MKDDDVACLKECEDLSKTRESFFFLCSFLFVYYSATISSIMTAMSLAVTERRCSRECAASSLLIGACICDMGECESATVSGNGFFFFFFPFLFFPTLYHDMLLTLTYLIKVFGAGQLDVAAKAVSAISDTL